MLLLVHFAWLQDLGHVLQIQPLNLERLLHLQNLHIVTFTWSQEEGRTMLRVETPGQPKAGETGADFLLSPHVSGLCKDLESLWAAWCAAAGPLRDGSAVF